MSLQQAQIIPKHQTQKDVENQKKKNYIKNEQSQQGYNNKILQEISDDLKVCLHKLNQYSLLENGDSEPLEKGKKAAFYKNFDDFNIKLNSIKQTLEQIEQFHANYEDQHQNQTQIHQNTGASYYSKNKEVDQQQIKVVSIDNINQVTKIQNQEQRVKNTKDQQSQIERIERQAEKGEYNKSQAETVDQNKSQAETVDQNKIQDQKVEQNKSQAEKAEYNKSQAEKAEQNKSKAEKAEYNKSQAEKIESNKSQAEKFQCNIDHQQVLAYLLQQKVKRNINTFPQCICNERVKITDLLSLDNRNLFDQLLSQQVENIFQNIQDKQVFKCINSFCTFKCLAEKNIDKYQTFYCTLCEEYSVYFKKN